MALEFFFFFLIIAIIANQKSQFYSELIILLAAIGMSFIPRVQLVFIKPDIIMDVVVPPLIFFAAKSLNWQKFKRVKRMSLALGIFASFVTTICVGFVLHALVPFIPLSFGFVLGAIVSPTDPISAISITSKMKLKKGITSMITAESLINDAIALILFAIATKMTQNKPIGNAFGLVLFNTIVPILIGLFFGLLINNIRKRVDDKRFSIVLPWVSSFFVFIVADRCGSSGIIAVMVFAFLIESASLKADSQIKREEDDFWKIIQLLFEIFVFGYIGLHAKSIVIELINNRINISITYTIIVSTIILILIMCVRPFIVVFFNQLFSFENKHIHKHFESKFSFPECIVVSWSSMRGLIGLTIVSQLTTLYEHNGIVVAIKFIALFCIFGTLLIQGFTLPWLINKLKINDSIKIIKK